LDRLKSKLLNRRRRKLRKIFNISYFLKNSSFKQVFKEFAIRFFGSVPLRFLVRNKIFFVNKFIFFLLRFIGRNKCDSIKNNFNKFLKNKLFFTSFRLSLSRRIKKNRVLTFKTDLKKRLSYKENKNLMALKYCRLLSNLKHLLKIFKSFSLFSVSFTSS
jgi:hypothetical protein